MIQLSHKRGFTLIELMLAMSVIGVLLVAIAMTSIFMMGTYTKGLTIREVNQAGRTITEDIQRTISMAAPFDVDEGKMYIQWPGQGGRLCTGSYTYVWNYGELIDDKGNVPTDSYNTYEGGDMSIGETENTAIRFAKVHDLGSNLCLDTSSKIKRDDARELIMSGDNSLAVRDLKVTAGARDDVSGQALYWIFLKLGTDGHGELDASNTACAPPSEGDYGFCSINQFDIIVRAGGSSGSR